MEHTEEIGKCNDEVFRLHPVKLNNQMQEAGEQMLDYKNKDFFALISGELTTETQDVGTITIQKELRMTLLRHWTLYDSISNSNYCVSRLKIGKEPGMKTFKRFLATIGVPLEQAKQKYTYMDPKIRNELKSKILNNTNEFGLDKILVDSFVR